MPDGAEMRTVDLATVRQALGSWLWQNHIIINGADDPVNESNPHGLGTAGDVPNVEHFISYLFNNFHTKE